ncbi:hypothetical protein BDZ85DRAFT_303470 [Elsinoe ampelina]|uniref:Uncharacterized protein n=1 Tax=Elsinoe ampelina TaxID=302913 RepID=A0A6A6G3V0_9PEZI|nr:hypothetical protein BDZ85DRAFT_303470 [Elsinoe ampelina]
MDYLILTLGYWSCLLQQGHNVTLAFSTENAKSCIVKSTCPISSGEEGYPSHVEDTSREMFYQNFILLSLTGAHLVSANPFRLAKRDDPYKIDIFTVDWFLENMKKPETGTCLFYRGGTFKEAEKYAKDKGLTVVFTEGLLDDKYKFKSEEQDDDLMCEIAKDGDQVDEYITHMSQAFAELCDGDAKVMAPDPQNVPMDKIWGKVEFPAVQKTDNKGGQINHVIAIDIDGENPNEDYWRRPVARRDAPLASFGRRGLMVRDDDEDCPDLEGLAEHIQDLF